LDAHGSNLKSLRLLGSEADVVKSFVVEVQDSFAADADQVMVRLPCTSAW